MKLITEDVQIEFAPEDTEAAIALAMLEVVRENGNGTKQSDFVLFEDVADVLTELVADGQLTVTTPNGNGDTHGVTYTEETPLTDKQRDTLAWLIDNDPEGASPAALAERFGIEAAAAQQRLRTLVDLGHAVHLARGRYRAL